ncbi:MAG: sodium:calcium antiporter [Chloroflexi bacterium]|nr:sodium:calcium antiporter [Chloroflexota bacterium]
MILEGVIGVWLQFLASAAILVVAAIKLADYGDVIGVRTRLGGMFVGTLLLAGATSLPELLTAANSMAQGVPNLTVGDLFGSSMFNMLMLAVLDLMFQQKRLLRRVAISHAVSAALAVLLMAMAMFFILADIELQIGWVGLDSLLLMGMYGFGMWLIRSSPTVQMDLFGGAHPLEPSAEMPSLRHALIGFALSAGVLVITAPFMVRSAVRIAEITGLTTGIVGMVFIAVMTSLPEVVTTVSAVHAGALDLAVGNLFGSNIFNMFVLGFIDLFYTQGRLFASVSPAMIMAGMLGLMLTALAGLGNLARVERRILFLEVDALFIILFYGLGMWLLITRRLLF